MRVSSSSLAQAILCEDLWCSDEAPQVVVEEDDMDCPNLPEDVTPEELWRQSES